MSLPHTIWAWGIENIGPSEKLVLVYLAFVVSEETAACSLSVGSLADMTGLSVRTIQRATASLHTRELIQVVRRQREDNANAENQYVLPTGAAIEVELAAEPGYPGFVYLMAHTADVGLFKIGYSTDPRRRLGQIQASENARVEIVCSVITDNMRVLEAQLHYDYAAYRVRGEWFRLPADAVARIQALAEEAE